MIYFIWKALHIIGAVCWFAELFYLPRLFVYHAMAQSEGDMASMRRFCVMERKLYIIGHIGMGLTLLFGLLLLWSNNWAFLKGQGWLHAKLLLVAGLVVYQFVCGRMNRAFAAGVLPLFQRGAEPGADWHCAACQFEAVLRTDAC